MTERNMKATNRPESEDVTRAKRAVINRIVGGSTPPYIYEDIMNATTNKSCDPLISRDAIITLAEKCRRISPTKAIEAGWTLDQVRIFLPFTYLATPYSHKNREIQVKRFVDVTKAAAWLLNETGWNVLSPITHSHPIHDIGKDVRGDWEFWKKIDTEFLQCCNSIVYFVVPGWLESTGVNAERSIAQGMGLIEWWLHPVGEDDYRLTKSANAPDTESKGDLDA